ncbi:MAG: hypothetical protein J6S67_18300 [Methanobrevibacter sp.]|nr:hypothetical protein [Methanobrevibacter sp.]
MNVGTAYDKNYVKLRNVSLSEAQMNDLIDGNGGYVKVNKSEALKKARRYQIMARKYAMLARSADVKDDEGDHDDHEYMHLDHYGDKWIVESTGGIKKEFDNEDEAVDYELSLHDHSDEKVEKDEARRRRAMAMARRRIMLARKASLQLHTARQASKAVIPASKRVASIQAPRISSAPSATDPSLKGLIR